MSKRMTAGRLEWWLKVQRDGKLGANFETLIRDFQTEREVVEHIEAQVDKIRYAGDRSIELYSVVELLAMFDAESGEFIALEQP